jgi:hypothetical protein
VTKRCFKCEAEKPLDEFYAHSRMADGHLNKCKDCTQKDVRQHRVKYPEKHREYDRDRAGDPKRVAMRVAQLQRHRREFPERVKARNILGNAVRDGKIRKLPCAFCGLTDRLEAHHHDYNKPLDVTWLCSACHSRYHALERMATYEREEAA